MRAHTPGEWHISPGYRVETINGTISCPGMTEADARLIAAAPDLLKALEALVRVNEEAWNLCTEGYDAGETFPAAYKAALAALAKARGDK